MGRNFVILGAGVLGLTVAIAAKLVGHSVRIVSAKRVGDQGIEADPFFASAFPAASIIPHSVAGDALIPLLSDSDELFGFLAGSPWSGVRLQQHYEIFESRLALPRYVRHYRNFKIHEDAGTLPIRRSQDLPPSGYSFSCFFCDMPIYGPWLVNLTARLAIPFERRSIDLAWLKDVTTDYIINCLGAGAHKVYHDIDPGGYYRGILLNFGPLAHTGAPISYNYTPTHDIYPGFGGKPADVYFYPRSRDCILGGTRQPGH